MLTCIIKFSRIPVAETAIDLIFMVEPDDWNLMICALFMIQFCRKYGKRLIVSFLRIKVIKDQVDLVDTMGFFGQKIVNCMYCRIRCFLGRNSDQIFPILYMYNRGNSLF